MPAPLPELTIDIPAPPTDQDTADGGVWLSLLPVLGLGAVAAFYLLRSSESGGGLGAALPLVILAGLSVVSAVLTVRWRTHDRQRRRAQQRGAYLRTLVYKRARLQAAHDAQRALLTEAHPAPTDGAQRALARAPEVWARRPADPDFLAVRLGIGDVPAVVKITPPDPDRAHPLLPNALALAEHYRTVREVPVRVRLPLAVCGAWPSVGGALRAWLGGLLLAHHPRDLRLHVILPDARPEEWRWLELVPHVNPSGQAGAPDLVALSPEAARPLLDTLSEALHERRGGLGGRGAHLLIVTDVGTLHDGGAALQALLRDPDGLNASLVVLAPSPELAPPECRAVVTVAQNRTFWLAEAGGETHGKADALSVPDVEALARALAGIARTDLGSTGALPRRVPFLDLYGVAHPADLAPVIADHWRQPVRGALPRPVPVGQSDADSALLLMLDEAHHGPHGMLAGTTGAGKSEFLQTLICALAIAHDPRLLNFLLIDFKGGSTLIPFARLPHTVGILTNLDGLLVERALDALRSELTQRQALLRERGLRDIGQYHRLHTATPAQMSEAGYRPLPHLVIIVDEFAQLARELPEFLAEWVRVAQVGRSLGVHLVLGTQSPAEVVTDELSANLQFRLCFRVQSIEASRAVLRRPDAAYLPADWPGRAYLQVGEGGMFAQFQTAYAGEDVRDAQPAERMVLEWVREDGAVVDLLDDADQPTAGYGSADLPDPAEPHTVARAVVDALIEAAHGRGLSFMPPLLLPPLGEHLTLRTAFSAAGVPLWNGAHWPPPDPDTLSAPIGLIDDVAAHRQPALTVTLRGAGLRAGHLLTVAAGLALRHAPDVLHLYALTAQRGALDGLSHLPHAEPPITLGEPERVRLLMRRLLARLDDPHARTPEHVVLLIDGFEMLRDPAYAGVYREVERLLSDGRAAGVYVVVSASGIGSLPERARGWLMQRIALQPTNPTDLTQTVGVVTLRAAQGGRVLPAGRGFVPDTPPRLCQVCLPCEFPADDPLAAFAELADEMRAAYRAQTGREHAPAPVRPLPARLPFETLAQPAALGSLSIALGVRDADGQPPLWVDWAAHGAAVVIAGGAGSGKTNLLRAAVLALAGQATPDQVAIVLIDLTGRALSPVRGLPHVAAHVTDPDQVAACLPHLTREPRRVAVFIDDYDLFSDGLTQEAPHLLRALRDLARQRPDLAIWAAGYLDRASDPLIRHLLMKRTGVALGGREALMTLGQRLSDAPPDALPLGRGWSVGFEGGLSLVQTAWVRDAAAWAAYLGQRWAGHTAQPWRIGDAPATPPAAPTLSSRAPLDIDTAGLIDDLLGGEGA
jgi:S-DNA-T family DNA segregation ATPase FtsK/SpoIIIE